MPTEGGLVVPPASVGNYSKNNGKELTDMSYYKLVVNKQGGPIEVKIHIGHAHWGDFWFSLYDQNGRNPTLVFEGINSDEIPDEFQITDLDAINNFFLKCNLRAIQHEVKDNALYYVQIRILQDGTLLHIMEAQGKFSQQVHSFSQVVRFIVEGQE